LVYEVHFDSTPSAGEAFASLHSRCDLLVLSVSTQHQGVEFAVNVEGYGVENNLGLHTNLLSGSMGRL
jgi:hypothetical protein